MPVALILLIVIVLIAMRWPIVNVLAGWLVVFPVITVSVGSIAWSLLIQRWESLFSVQGYGTTLVVFAVPVALWVVRLNR